MDPALLAILVIFGFPLSIPLLNIWAKHQREMLELRLKLRQQGGVGVSDELEAVRQEIRALRETSMQYDLSFDAALQRLEQRVARTEQATTRATAYEQPSEVAATLHGGN